MTSEDRLEHIETSILDISTRLGRIEGKLDNANASSNRRVAIIAACIGAVSGLVPALLVMLK